MTPLANKLGALLAGSDFQSGLLSGLVLLGIGLVGRLLSARSRLAWGTNHQFWFSVPRGPDAAPDSGPMAIVTRTVHVMNEGRAAAEDVEIHLAHEPTHFQLWPTFDFQTITPPSEGFIIRIPNVGPGEHFALEMLQMGMAPPLVSRVRSKSGEAISRVLVTNRRYSRPQLIATALLMFLGLFTAIRLIVAFILSALT